MRMSKINIIDRQFKPGYYVVDSSSLDVLCGVRQRHADYVGYLTTSGGGKVYITCFSVTQLDLPDCPGQPKEAFDMAPLRTDQLLQNTLFSSALEDGSVTVGDISDRPPSAQAALVAALETGADVSDIAQDNLPIIVDEYRGRTLDEVLSMYPDCSITEVYTDEDGVEQTRQTIQRSSWEK